MRLLGSGASMGHLGVPSEGMFCENATPGKEKDEKKKYITTSSSFIVHNLLLKMQTRNLEGTNLVSHLAQVKCFYLSIFT